MQPETPDDQDDQADHAEQTPLRGGRDDDNTTDRKRRVQTTRPLPTVEDDQTERARSLRTAFEQAAVGIAFVSPQGPWLHVNQRVCDLLGYDRAELAAHTWQDLTYPDDRDTSTAYVRLALAGEIDEYELDKRYIHKDGVPVWAHLTVSLVRNPEGKPNYFISTLQDIAERKRLERERTHLLERERAARREAEATNVRLQAMQALTDTALSHLDLDDLLRELLGRVTAVMGVDTVAILLLDADGQTLAMRAARGLGEEDAGRVQMPVGQGFVGRITASRAPVIVDADTLSAADFEGVHPILRERLRALAGVPLLVEDRAAGQLVEGQLVGVLAVGSATPHRFTVADVQLLQRAADRIAMAVDRARLYAAEQDARQRSEAALARAQASEAQAAERAAHLHTILETMADGVAVYDAEGRPVQMVNQAYRELFSLDRGPAEYEALPTFDRARLVHLRDATTGALLPFARTPVGRALRGEVVTGPSADIRVQTFDGRELEVNSSAAPLRDQNDGRVVGAVLVLRDGTWRKQLERKWEAARVQAERQADELDRIFEATADGLIVYDAAGRMARANGAARRILGLDAVAPGFDQLPLLERLAHYATRDEQGHPIPPEELPFLRVLRGETGTGAETRDLRMRALDGREIELTFTVAPLRDQEGHIMGAVSAFRDRTERNRLEREREAARADELAAREVSRRLEAFLATAAHDLRTPLTSTIGYLALAQRRTERLAAVIAQEECPDIVQSVEAVRDRLEEADTSAARLARLLTLLFDTAAVRAGKLELHRAPCDLAALLREQVEALRVAAPERTITLHTPNGDAPIPVEVDADRIGQVLTNYVTNALKYAPPDQPIAVSVAAHRGRARVTVRDAGPGIPQAEQARVWELFHRAPGVAVKAGTSRQGPGTSGSLGLGLSISKAIVEAHGGRVGVTSAVGQGSTFWFTLPLTHAHTDSHAEVQADATTL